MKKIFVVVILFCLFSGGVIAKKVSNTSAKKTKKQQTEVVKPSEKLTKAKTKIKDALAELKKKLAKIIPGKKIDPEKPPAPVMSELQKLETKEAYYRGAAERSLDFEIFNRLTQDIDSGKEKIKKLENDLALETESLELAKKTGWGNVKEHEEKIKKYKENIKKTEEELKISQDELDKRLEEQSEALESAAELSRKRSELQREKEEKPEFSLEDYAKVGVTQDDLRRAALGHDDAMEKMLDAEDELRRGELKLRESELSYWKKQLDLVDKDETRSDQEKKDLKNKISANMKKMESEMEKLKKKREEVLSEIPSEEVEKKSGLAAQVEKGFLSDEELLKLPLPELPELPKKTPTFKEPGEGESRSLVEQLAEVTKKLKQVEAVAKQEKEKSALEIALEKRRASIGEDEEEND
ncbi:MAG: hypothetical protein ABIA74_05030 [bacterium]